MALTTSHLSLARTYIPLLRIIPFGMWIAVIMRRTALVPIISP